MRFTLAAAVLAFTAFALPAAAANCPPTPNSFTNGTSADATQVNANFANLDTCVNSNLAHSGANSDITALSGLTTPITSAQMSATGVTPGTYPTPGTIGAPSIVVGADGRISSATSSPIGGTLLDITVMSTSGTWTRPTGTNYIVVVLVGGGGGGAGASSTSNNHAQAGGGGQAGAYGMLEITSPSPTYAVGVGPGGTGGTAGNNGSTGSASTIAGFLCSGGLGGTKTADTGGGSYGYGGFPGSPQTCGGGTLLFGTTGSFGPPAFVNGGNFAIGGVGGSSPFSGNGTSGGLITNNQSFSGGNAPGPGSGGGGGATMSGGTAESAIGGNGAAGLVIIYSYS